MRNLKVAAILLAILSIAFLSQDQLYLDEEYNKTTFTVEGMSMDPIIQEGDEITLIEGYYKNNNISVGDIVIYSWAGNDDPLIKYVKAVPGDSLYLDSCNLIRNGNPITNSEGVRYCIKGDKKGMISLYEGDDINGYLILGNRPSGSLDSTRFGLVSRNNILGKVDI